MSFMPSLQLIKYLSTPTVDQTELENLQVKDGNILEIERMKMYWRDRGVTSRSLLMEKPQEKEGDISK